MSRVDQDQTFATGTLPSNDSVNLAVTRPAEFAATSDPAERGVELVDLVQTNSTSRQAFVTDLDGNVLWYYDTKMAGGQSIPLKPLSNGHMLALIANSTTSNALREVDLAGNTVPEITADTLTQLLQARGYSFTINEFHHDMLPLPNGHIILLTNIIVPYTNLPGYPGTTT